MSAEDYHADFYDPPDYGSDDDSHLTHHPKCPHYERRFIKACLCRQLCAAVTEPPEEQKK